MKSKIVLLGPAYPLRGGLATFNESLAKALQQRGHEVRIITFSLQYPSFLFPGKSQYGRDKAPAQLSIEAKINSVNPVNWLAVGRRLRKAQPDLIIPSFWLPFMGPSLGIVSALARKNGQSLSIALVHNLIPHESRPGDRIFTKLFTRSMDGFVALSQEVLNDIKAFEPGRPAAWHPHPIYDHFGPRIPRGEALRQLALPADKKYLLFFGFIRPYKGLDILLRAMAHEILKSRDDLRLIVAGEFYEDEKKYMNLISEAGLEEKVILHTKFIPDAEVARYFSAAHAVVQPYRSATQSGVTQIAYHFDVPMIVSNVGGLPEIVPHGRVGLVTEPEEGALARAIDEILDEKRLKKFSAAIGEEKKRFSWDKMGEAFEKLYLSIKEKKP